MEGESMTDFGAFAIRQSDPRFRSPGIARKQFGKEALTAHSIKRARRAKSTEPTPLGSHDPFNKYAKKDAVELNADTQLVGEKRLSLSTKIQENMSKTELINSYRLLMSEKLRLERFLSIMSKNHEMARTRLESDLLDAMMCIEDLKQALELRMARDPREAEERRYLIRQNKKLLNQASSVCRYSLCELYESAKKIERLELTKVEMKEQLELLDFQILEVENQKTMMEEELRRLPSCNNTATQTEDNSNSTAQLILKLQAQIAVMQSDVCSQKAETAAAVARQQHLENLVRDLRRDNVDLRDQLAKLDDAENSLAESDKPLAAGTRLLQAQLEAQVERIRELESKLKATRDYANELESRLRTMQKENQSMEHADEVVSAPLDTASSTQVSRVDVSADREPSTSSVPVVSQLIIHTFRPATCLVPLNGMDALDLQAAMSNGNLNSSGLRVPRVDDLLLQETIRTFQSLITERDQELMQLRRHIRSNLSTTESTDQPPLILPQLFESAVQTDLIMAQADKLSGLIDALAEGGILLTAEQNAALTAEIKQSLKVLSENDATGEQPDENGSTDMKRTVGYADLLSNVSKLRQEAERMKMRVALSELALTPDTPVETKAFSPVQANESNTSACLFSSKEHSSYSESKPDTLQDELKGSDYAEIICETLRKLKGEDIVGPLQPKTETIVCEESSLLSDDPQVVTPSTCPVDEVEILNNEPLVCFASDQDMQLSTLISQDESVCVEEVQSVEESVIVPTSAHTNQQIYVEKQVLPITQREPNSRLIEKPTSNMTNHAEVFVDLLDDIFSDVEIEKPVTDGNVELLPLSTETPRISTDNNDVQTVEGFDGVSLHEPQSAQTFSKLTNVSRLAFDLQHPVADMEAVKNESTPSLTATPTKAAEDPNETFDQVCTVERRLDMLPIVRFSSLDNTILLKGFPNLISDEKFVTLPGSPELTVHGTMLLDILCSIHQECLSLWLFTKSLWYSQQTEHSCHKHEERGPVVDIYTLVRSLQGKCQKLAAEGILDLIGRLPKAAFMKLKHPEAHDCLNNPCASVGELLFSTSNYWLTQDVTVQRTNVKITIKKKSGKQAWLNDAFAFISLARISQFSPDRLFTHERTALQRLSCMKTPAVRDCYNVLFTSVQTTSNKVLPANLRYAMLTLQDVSINWLVAATDLFHLPLKSLSNIYIRLLKFDKEHHFPSAHFAHSFHPDQLSQLRSSLILEVLWLRICLTFEALVPDRISDGQHQAERLNRVFRALNFRKKSDISIKSHTLLRQSALENRLFLQIKYALWNLVVNPVLTHCPRFVLDAIVDAIQPSIRARLYYLAAKDRHLLFIILFRVFCALHFEPACLIPSVTANCHCHSYAVPVNLQFKSAVIHGYHTLRSRDELVESFRYYLYEIAHGLWLLTGIWPGFLDTKWHNYTADELWMKALFFKEALLHVLFGNESDSRTQTNSLQSCVAALASHRSDQGMGCKLWLPTHRLESSLSADFFILTRVIMSAVVNLLRTYPVSKTVKCQLAKAADLLDTPHSSQVRKSPSARCFLRRLEEFRDKCYNSSAMSMRLAQFWCHTSDDLEIKSQVSMSNSSKFFVGGVLKPIEKILLMNSPRWERSLIVLEPSFYFTIVSEMEENNSFGAFADQISRQFTPTQLMLVNNLSSEESANGPVLVSDQQQDDKQDRVDLTCPEPTRSPNFPTTDSNHEEKLISDSVNLSEGRPLSAPVDPSLNNEPSGTTAHTPKHYRTQLQELKQTGELELARAHLSVSERRRQELERRVLELGEELARARAEARAAETSLSAARRTEAALRRRLLVAMDMQGTDGDLASHRHSTGANFGVAVEAQSTLELQASLIKSEAANASLNEAAQLDRTRLHDQAMRIGQLEAERRALLDRISALQVSEATAQRGIVRLQALYEDMLREYSESRSPELSWRTRDRSRSNYRQTADRDAGGRLPAGAKSMITTMQLQERISELESENLSLKEGLKQLETNKCSVTSQPVGRCSAPACVEVRRLLKAFQERFSDVMGQLTRTQQCLDALQSNSNEPKTETVDSMSEETCLGLITSVQQQLSMLGGALKQHASSGDKLDDSARKLISCSNQLSYLAKWLRGYLKHTDAEILQLRSAILHFQISSVDGEHTITTASSDPDAEHPFSCSIRLNKKLNVDLLSEKEDEIAQLRGRLRDLESQLEVVSAQPEPM
ncbi:hypothetical protein PHET_05309 [Paragonimus heterotremus]|uniref:Uncharacterized protein n=1 Tax=Paragonimus heterotremus TaxID=100268 RepID=A0A8J4SYD8_9TREM|nr:hypothetical protein PHET_05309 [Paragonimus heterotremus]